MDLLNTEYRDIVEKILQDYADFLDSDDDVEVEVVFDRPRDRYLLVEAGWQHGYRIYGTLLHVDIVEGRLWIQHDGTEDGIAGELVEAGIPKQDIVLGYRSSEGRKLTGFAIS